MHFASTIGETRSIRVWRKLSWLKVIVAFPFPLSDLHYDLLWKVSTAIDEGWLYSKCKNFTYFGAEETKWCTRLRRAAQFNWTSPLWAIRFYNLIKNDLFDIIDPLRSVLDWLHKKVLGRNGSIVQWIYLVCINQVSDLPLVLGVITSPSSIKSCAICTVLLHKHLSLPEFLARSILMNGQIWNEFRSKCIVPF